MDKDNQKLEKLRLFVKTNLMWLGFSVLFIALVYAFVTVLFDKNEPVLDVAYALIFIFLLFGIRRAFNKEKEEVKRINFKSLDGVAVIIGVFSTYSLVHFLGIPVVIASSGIGLVGFLIIRKYEVPLYCGSFAGMVSVTLFGFFEVLVLAIICAFIFVLTKPIFKGYGGKLGTIAFFSSLIVHSIFNDQYLVLSIDVNIVYLFITTISGVMLTFYFHNLLSTSAVFSSALFSFVFGFVVFLLFPEHIDYMVIFFSASFIGMSSKEKLPGLFYVFMSGVILGVLYLVFLEFFNGLGGKLGLLAMITVIVTSGLSILIRKTYYLLNRVK